MFSVKIARISVLCAGLFIVAGCAGQPFVQNPGEFNRETAEFIKGATDREFVTVCYAKSATAASLVTKAAVEECGRFGKTAVFREQNYKTCPLLTPVAAIYDCVGRTAAGLGS